MKYIRKINENKKESLYDYVERETFILNDLYKNGTINSFRSINGYYSPKDNKFLDKDDFEYEESAYDFLPAVTIIFRFDTNEKWELNKMYSINIDNLIKISNELKHLSDKLELDGYEFKVEFNDSSECEIKIYSTK